MPHKLRAAQCTITSFSTNCANSYQGLWITDALLTETFHKFCRAPRRYGSNVPGPLEARRRSSRRKNTSMAYAGAAGSSVYDTAAILGARSSEKQWWKKSKDTSSPSESGCTNAAQPEWSTHGTLSLLPTWLFNPAGVHSPSIEAQYDGSKSEAVLENTKEDGNIGGIEQGFSKALSMTETLDSVRDLIDAMNLKLGRHPHLAESAFRHLMDRYRTTGDTSDLVGALRDPELNPSGSRNCLLMMQHLCSNQVSQRTWLLMLIAIVKSIELGLVSVQDLQAIILLVPKVRRVFQRSSINAEIVAEWKQILNAIEKSRVLQLRDFDSAFLAKWYRQIVNLSLDEDSQSVRWKLRKFSGVSELELAAKITVEKLGDSLLDAKALDKVVRWIVELPDQLQGPTVVQATFSLIELAMHRQPLSEEIFKNWSLILAQLPPDIVLKGNTAMWSDRSMNKHGLTPMQRALSVVWIVTQLPAQQAESQFLASETVFNQELLDALKVTPNLDQLDNMADLILTMDSLPLPQKDLVLPLVERMTNRRLKKLWENKQYVEGLKNCSELEFAQLRDHIVTQKLRYSVPHVLTTFSESINSDLTQFTALAQKLIFKSDRNFKIVHTILRHNMRLKFAAYKSWPAQIVRDTSYRSEKDINPTFVLDMLEKITMAFAVTPVATPRQAFRAVYKMYLFLHRISAPINPVIIRALWHAGVTRYGEHGAAEGQVDWCLFKVREAEGADIAHRLLWSTGFRRKVVFDFVQSLEGMTEPGPCPEDLRDIHAP